MKELIKALKQNNNILYDFISSSGYKLEKNELLLLLKELDYIVYVECKEKYNDIIKKLIENMEG